MSFTLTVLGCQSATPRSFAFPTSQFLEINGHNFLIDCGEGTQMQLRKFKIRFTKIKHIFISHLHGDHFFGLIGLLSSFGLLGRDKELHIFGPKNIKKITEMQLELTKSHVTYPIVFHELESTKSEIIFEDDKVSVRTIPLKHRIYTNGYLFTEKPKKRKLNIEAIKKYPEIEICDYNNLKAGKDYTLESGETVPNAALTFDPPKPLSYAFCSDTAYHPEIVPIIKGVDLLYHESTFLEDKKGLAETTNHSTAFDAGRIARMAGVKKLLIGHFSSRYESEHLFLEEAQKAFDNVELAYEGKVIRWENT